MSEPSASPEDTRPVLVTGGAGFIGSNLVDRLASEGHRVLIYDALMRPGVERNLAWLRGRHPDRVHAVRADVRDAAPLAAAAASAKAVFHLAAQVAVTTSMVEPIEDFQVNVAATVALLDALRRRGEPVPMIYASTNKVYGDLADIPLRLEGDAYVPDDRNARSSGVAEVRPLDFHTPYGCSKGAADQYVLDYARSFGLSTCVLRMSCIYGPRQMGTEDQGWVAHFVIQALEGRPVSIYGDGRQVRDILHVADAVEAYMAAWGKIAQVTGRAFNLGGGPNNAVSLRQLIGVVDGMTGRPMELAYADWRAGDQRWYVSDTRRVRRELSLPQPRAWREGVADLLAWLKSEREAAA